MASENIEQRIEQHLESGFAALERGDLAGAKKAANAVLKLDDKAAEAHMLLGGIAGQEGDAEGLRHAYTEARKAEPSAFEPVLALAEIEHAEGNIDAARKHYADALDVAEEEEEFVEAVLASAEFELAEGAIEAARTVLAELPLVELPSPNDHLRAGDLLRQIGVLLPETLRKETFAEAARHFSAAGSQADGDASIGADALYGAALVAEARDDKAEATKLFSEVYVLDAKEAPPAWSLPKAKVEELLTEIIDELPEQVADLLQDVSIVVEARPARAAVADGMDPRLLGLFSGTAPVLEQITLFTCNLERAATSVEDFADELSALLLEESTHFFGLDEDALLD